MLENFLVNLDSNENVFFSNFLSNRLKVIENRREKKRKRGKKHIK